jgi:YesN/AraC family two-component response regulator
LNFTQIAAELGYSDYAYFSKLFRKHVGVNPSQFVNQYSGFPQM